MAAMRVVFCLLIVTGIGGTPVPSAGPYKIIIDNLQTCKDEGTGQVHFDNKIHHQGNGKHVYNTDVFFGFDLDEKITLKAEMQKWSSQGYRPRALSHTMKGCQEGWKLLKSFFTGFAKAAGLTITSCPIPQGNFTARDWEIVQHLDGIDQLPYSKYKGVLEYYREGVKVGCVEVFMNIIPDTN